MLRSFPPEMGYDFTAHWEYAEWIRREGTIPPLEALRLANHPPLYYLFLAWLIDLGGGPHAAQVVSVIAGIARLGLTWLGLEYWLPEEPLARRTALALTAVLPVSVLIDGTVSGETVCATLVALALLLVRPAFGSGPRATTAGATLGAVLGVAVLVKVSAVTVLGVLAVGVLGQLVWNGRDGWQGRARRLAPFLGCLLVFLATTGWYFAWNRAIYGKAIVTFFDTPGLRYMPATYIMPVYFRRPPEFYFHWSAEIHTYPYNPAASLDRARFFPLLVASTFVDYYNHEFAPPRAGVPTLTVNDRRLPSPALPLGRASMLAGTLIAAMTTMAWAILCVRSWSTRNWAALALLLVPASGVAAQAWYAHVYPHDWLAVIKGAYVFYAAPPLFAAFGLGVAWLARRARVLAAVPLLACAVVAAYTLWSRAV
jgi:hypothetical protein